MAWVPAEPMAFTIGGCCRRDADAFPAHGTGPGADDLLESEAQFRLTRTGLEYDGTFLVSSCVDLATQLAKYVLVCPTLP